MKKARIFLSVLTVLALVGGALAFKAKQTRTFAFCDTQLANPLCVLDSYDLPFVKTTRPIDPGIIIDADIFGVPCDVVNGAYTCTTKTTLE